MSILTGAKDGGLLHGVRPGLPTKSPISLAAGEAAEMADQISALHNDELIKMMVVLLVAGNETTRNAISGGVQLLIENPDERQKLIDDPSLLNGAVEEILRLVTPIHSFSRTVTTDTELRGKKLQRGQKIVLAYPSANRDPEQFDEQIGFESAATQPISPSA